MATGIGQLTNVLDPAKMGPDGEVFLDGFLAGDITSTLWQRWLPASTRTIEKASIEPPSGYATPTSESGDYDFKDLAEGFTVTYTQAQVAIGFAIGRFANLFLDPVAKMEFIRMVGNAAARKMEADSYAIITDNATGPDGSALYATDHGPNSGTAADQSNTGTSALDYVSLTAAFTVMARLKSPDGLIAGTRPDTLIVPPDMLVKALQIANSMVVPGHSAAAAVDGTLATATTAGQANVVGGWLKNIVAAPDVADTNDWYLVDAVNARFKKYIRKGPTPTTYVDIDSDAYRIKDFMSYADGHDNTWRYTFGSIVA